MVNANADDIIAEIIFIKAIEKLLCQNNLKLSIL